MTFLGAGVSESRAAWVLSWGAVVAGGVYFIALSWPNASRVTTINRASVVVAVLVVGFFVVHGAAGPLLQRGFSRISKYASVAPTESCSNPVLDKFLNVAFFGDRELQRNTAFSIWRDYPWFGTGGWGQRHLAAMYCDEKDRSRIVDAGLANTHCDPLQFLSEFGVVGLGCLVFAVIGLAASLRQVGWRVVLQTPLLSLSLFGLAITFCYSCSDLPFRSPAVLCTVAFVLAALPRMSLLTRECVFNGRNSSWRPDREYGAG